jgi:FkbM family methyltransferase
MFDSFLLNVIDGGAAGGFKDLKALHSFIAITGFEPDETACQKLKEQIYPRAGYHSYISIPCVLYHEDGTSDFFYANNPDMNSLLEPDMEQFDMLFGLSGGSKYWKDQITTKGKGQVRTTNLDNYCRTNAIKHIDYLKLDTQGTEDSVLRGAKQLLENSAISIIKIEVSLLSIYKNQCTIGGVQAILEEHDYVLIDCEFYPDGITDKGASVIASDSGLHDKLRRFPVGDCIYMKVPEKLNTKHRKNAAIILAQLGYGGAALAMLCRNTTLTLSEATAILKPWMLRPKNQLLANIVKPLIPPFLYNALRKIVKNK